MAMNSKDFTVEAAKAFLEKEYPSTIGDETLTEADKIFNEKLASSAREKIKNPSSKVWDSLVKKQAIIGGDTFPLSPENTKALGRAVEDDAVKAMTRSGKSAVMKDMLSKMTPETRADILSRPNVIDNIQKYIASSSPNDFKKFEELKYKIPTPEVRTVGSGMNTLGNVIGPAIAVAQGATVAQGIMDKMKAGESFKEAASNPELVKDAARGVLGYIGANAGALAGSMAPGGLPAKAAAELAGAVGVGYAGSKLADLLTGNPVVDKIIRARYEKARNERMAKTKPTAASSVELRPGE